MTSFTTVDKSQHQLIGTLCHDSYKVSCISRGAGCQPSAVHGTPTHHIPTEKSSQTEQLLHEPTLPAVNWKHFWSTWKHGITLKGAWKSTVSTKALAWNLMSNSPGLHNYKPDCRRHWKPCIESNTSSHHEWTWGTNDKSIPQKVHLNRQNAVLALGQGDVWSVATFAFQTASSASDVTEILQQQIPGRS